MDSEKPKLELLPDDDDVDLGIADLDIGTQEDKTPKVACATCEMVGPYNSEDIEKGAVTFQVMRMQDCGHGVVYGVLDEHVRAKVKVAQKQRDLFYTLARGGDEAGAKRAYKKLNTAIKNIKIRQRMAWAHNRHQIDMIAIPELENAG